MPQFIIIADDLTGANDTGVQFAKRGLSTVSLMDVNHQEPIDAEVLVYNAETRALEPRMAYEVIKTLSKELEVNRIPFVYKKIDSTLRGNVGAEIDAIMDQCNFDLAIVVPAYPASSRLTIGGYHLVHQLLLEDSEISRDPKFPVKQSYLPALLAEQTRRKVGHIDIRGIRDSKSGCANHIIEQKVLGHEIMIFDTAKQEDLQTIAESVFQTDLRVLWVGSAGLAQCLAEKFGNITERKEEAKQNSNYRFPILVIAGSVSSITKNQVQQLNEQEDYHIVIANPLLLIEETKQEMESQRLIREISTIIDNGKNPILITDSSKEMRCAVEEWGITNKKDVLFIGNTIADRLGELGAHITSTRQLSGVIATGGDIASGVCQHLKVQALEIVDEVEEGIPLSRIVGGSGDGLPIVTKAGAFGNPYSLVRAVQKIKTYY